MSGDAHPDPARDGPVRCARGGAGTGQGARGHTAEEGAALSCRVWTGSDAAGRPGELRSADRTGRGSRADHPDSFAANKEQSDPSGRARRRQDGHRRGPGAADRGGQGSHPAGREKAPGARSLTDRGRHQVSRPVRGAAKRDSRRAQGESRSDRVYRRDSFSDRRRIGRGLAGCCQHPEAGSVAR